MKTQAVDLFPIPFFRGIDALSKEQIFDIIKLLESIPNNFFGYHGAFGEKENSKSTFYTNSDILRYIDNNIPSCKGLLESIQRVIDSYCLHFGIEECVIGNSWINVQKKGAKTAKHMHGRVAILAATIYVRKCGTNGDTYFSTPNPFSELIPRRLNPLTNTNNVNMTKYTLETQKINCNDGDMLIFPAWIRHESMIHNEDEDRIILAFNCILKYP